WLTEFTTDELVDSQVRTRIYYALRRAGIPLSIPAHALFLTEDTSQRKSQKYEGDLKHRRDALAQVDLFGTLSDAERDRLALSMRHAPFCRGETLTRQGDEAHWLYVVTHGEVAVRVAV